jgi:uncharacterized membrane protein YiaA
MRRHSLTIHICMRVRMRDLALQAAGVLAILVAIAHGIIVERKVFARVRIEPQRTRGLLRMLCQASTLDWIGIGVLLIAAPTLGSDAARLWIIAVAIIVYGYAAIGNAVATRGRHIGWLLMTCVVGFALMGL